MSQVTERVNCSISNWYNTVRDNSLISMVALDCSLWYLLPHMHFIGACKFDISVFYWKFMKSQQEFAYLDWIRALNRSVVLWMQHQNEWGSCDGWISTTLALGLPIGLMYFCPQNSLPHCSKKRVSWATALCSIHRKTETFASGVFLRSRSRK